MKLSEVQKDEMALIKRTIRDTAHIPHQWQLYPVRLRGHVCDTWQLEIDGDMYTSRLHIDEDWPHWMCLTRSGFSAQWDNDFAIASKTYIQFTPRLQMVYKPHIIRKWQRTTGAGDVAFCMTGLDYKGRVQLSQRHVKYGLAGIYTDFMSRLLGTPNPHYVQPGWYTGQRKPSAYGIGQFTRKMERILHKQEEL